MNSVYFIRHILLISTLLLSLHHSAQADDDYIEARRLLKAGKILPLEKILKNIRKSYPGKILEVDLEKDNGRIVYEIEILANDGVVKELYINARSGELISVKEDD